MSNGWVKIHRSILSHEYWLGEVFTPGQAWIDILLLACFKPRQVWIGADVVQLNRGEMIISERWLMERWRWGSSRVRTFLKQLQLAEMITITNSLNRRTSDAPTIEKSTKNRRRLLVVNYERYQAISDDADEEPTQNRRTTDAPTVSKPTLPKKKEERKKEDQDKAQRADELANLTFPTELDTATNREAWGRWLEHKRALRKSYKSPASQETALRSYAKAGLVGQRFVDAVEYSITQNYQGLFEKGRAGSNGKPSNGDHNLNVLESILKGEA